MYLLTVILASLLIQGRVMLQGETPAPGDYVMVYSPELRIGTLSDENGNYSLSLPDTGAALSLEYSRIGFSVSTCRLDASLLATVERGEDGGGLLQMPLVTLEPQLLMLTAALVTPDGVNPAEFILDKVLKTAGAVRKNHLSYEADISYDFSTHEIPLMATALSNGQLGLTKFAGSLMGIGPLVKYCLVNDDIYARASLHRSVVKGHAKDSDGRIVKSTPDPLPKNVQKDIIEFFGKIDLFELLYGQGGNFGKSFSKKHKFQLEGSYEYNDNLVYVLSCRAYKMGIKLHVVDGEWGIMKMQIMRSRGEVLRIEARPVCDGIYMPVTFIMNPSLTHIRNAQIPEVIAMVRDNKQLKKSGKARLIAILEERYRNHEDFNPYIACGFAVQYR